MKGKHMGIDETDQRILLELKKNCKRSYRELSVSTGMSPAALIERIRRLEKDGAITSYSANFDYLKLGFEFMAIVEISISGKDLLKVEEQIAGLPHVGAVWDTTGDYDALAIVMCKTRSDLSAIVKRILGIKGVEKTNTNIVLNVVKRLTEFEEV